jgi:hypothetical protein
MRTLADNQDGRKSDVDDNGTRMPKGLHSERTNIKNCT